MKLEDMTIGTRFTCRRKVGSSSGKTLRAKKEDQNTVFVYGYRKRKYGYRYTDTDFLRTYEIVESTLTETEKWHRRIQKILNIMAEYNLWTEWKEKLQNLLHMTWEDHEALNQLYWDTPLLRHFDSKEWKMWFQKYPFLKNSDGIEITVNTDYLWELSRAELKTMYFGKRANRDVKNTIKTVLKERRDYSCSERVGYDVIFDYKASVGHAWYAEQYRDCGNGHYYLALSENCAWFCEHD